MFWDSAGLHLGQKALGLRPKGMASTCPSHFREACLQLPDVRQLERQVQILQTELLVCREVVLYHRTSLCRRRHQRKTFHRYRLRKRQNRRRSYLCDLTLHRQTQTNFSSLLERLLQIVALECLST